MPDILVPVFVFPNSLTFNLADQSSYKQVLTVYNPYEFPVRFQVLCSAKDKHKYTVVDPEGCIQSHCRVDIVVRHNEVSNQNVGQSDKFRIQMYQYSTNKLIGKKDIKAELLAEKEDDRQTPERETFQELPMTNAGQTQQQFSLPKRQGRPGTPNRLVIVVFLLFITVLLLPSHGEDSNILPDNLKPTFCFKLAVSYILGLITMAILRPN
ncbi:UNVERIFIED_CONTAM: hypothetical protein PYX00_002966 [Menopon gallinae]|uniref:MSP domain-containing protein n=1 Tax=Menopon gallinae TaxID=328185 RepID=A0AAW2HYI6_9NEOP